MAGAVVDQHVIADLLQMKMPKLVSHCCECGFDPASMVINQWFISLFSYNFSAEIVIKLWDTIFVKGDKMLFRIALAIFHLLQQQLMK